MKKYVRRMQPLLQRVLEQIEFRRKGCWLWKGYVNDQGYAVISYGRAGESKDYRVHTLLYTVLIGPIPGELEPDHLCRTRSCVNPWHCEPVTHAENLARGQTMNRLHRLKVCARGHDVSGENEIQLSSGRVRCKKCHREGAARRRRG